MYNDPYQGNQPPYNQPGTPSGQPESYPHSTYGPPGSMPYGQPSSAPTNPYESPGEQPANPYGQPGSLPSQPYATPAPWPNYVQPQPQKSRRGLWITLSVIGAVLLLLCIGGTILASALANVGQSELNKQATATASIKPTPTPELTGPQKDYAQATAGTPAVNDSLSQQSENRWDVTKTDDNAQCMFSGGAYQVLQPNDGRFMLCYAEDPIFNDFAVEVQMNIISGQRGGLILRSNIDKDLFYYLRLSRSGTYALLSYSSAKDSKTIGEGTTNLFSTSLNQPSLITLIARGSDLSLYINKQFVTKFTDSTYTSGHLGLAASSQSTIAFSNLKIWKL